MRRIVDCFPFCHELDILELRLNILDSVVDFFVLVEGSMTFTGKPKPLFFAENIQKFGRWKDRIAHVAFSPSEECDPWLMESEQRRELINGIPNLQSSDVVIHSDVDEIPDPEAIKRYNPSIGIQGMAGYHSLFYLNTQLIHQKEVGPKIFPKSILSRVDFAQIRHYDCELWGHVIPDAMWHFSYCGGVKVFLYKVGAYGHRDEIDPESHNRMSIESVLKDPTKPRVILPGQPIVARKLDKTFPEYVRKNRQSLKSKGLLWGCL